MVDLMGKRNYFFGLSILIILAGIVGYIVHNGFNLDIEFEGGTVIEMQMNDDRFDTTKVEQIASLAINKKVTAQKSETLNTKDNNSKINMLIMNIASKDTLTGSEQTKLVDAIKKEFGLKNNVQMTVTNINPSIGQELLGKGLNAIIMASLLIIIYIWIRFRVMSGLSAGITAVIALLHDAFLMLSVYTIFNIPLNESFIAAVLTVLGYSMNDTIIIYDRIRENSGLLRKTPIAELVNKSIIQTLSRSINTVVTVLICLITVYVYASYYNIGSIKEFSFPLIIGVSSGCYSSIFIASPLWIIWKQAQVKKKISTAKTAKV